MKIPINLASQPFRRDRAMIVASIAVSLLLVGVLGGLISLILMDRAQFADVRQDLDRLNRQTRKVDAEQAQQDAILRRPENAEVLERSVFLNALLLRKGISWTQIFADLEKTVPYNVRVIQIHPAVDANDQVSLDMTVGSEQPGPLIEMFKAFNQSPKFGAADIKLQQQPTQSEPLYRVRLVVPYAQKL
jgi:type IV pilus assembly protein PilN